MAYLSSQQLQQVPQPRDGHVEVRHAVCRATVEEAQAMMARWMLTDQLEEEMGHWATEAAAWSPPEAQADWNMWCSPLVDMMLRQDPSLQRLWTTDHERRIMAKDICDRVWYSGHQARQEFLR
eukprot:1123538-Pyramimonas_sp.AAC.1